VLELPKFVLTPFISADHVTVNFARSGGPGGQNVNKGFMLSPLSFFSLHIIGASFSCA